MLAQILPGVRHVRTPLATGSLWLLVTWLFFGRNLPTPSEATGLWADLYRLADTLGQPVMLGALGVAAYVIGARAAWLLEKFQDALREHTQRLPARWRPTPFAPLVPPQIEEVIATVATRYPSGEYDDEEEHLRDVFRTALSQAVAEAKYRWPAEAPDLFQEYDRRESERDFSDGISTPLAALSFGLVVIGSGWAWVALALVIVALLSKQAGYYHQRELERFVLEAVMVGRVSSRLTAVLLDWSEKSGQRLVTEPASEVA
ncbi:hypothetical protein [Micromonospora chersina]|uniref:hypothetical protein n=1 Tax=Micromonospora chersina TaxID=47854 RepID=UPI0036A2EFA0